MRSLFIFKKVSRKRGKMKKNNTLVICFLIAILIAIIHGMPDTKSKSSNFNSNKPNINMSNPAEYMSQMDGHSQEQF